MKGFKIVALCVFILLFVVFCQPAGNSLSAGSRAENLKVSSVEPGRLPFQCLDDQGEKKKMLRSKSPVLLQNKAVSLNPQATSDSENVDLTGRWETIGQCEAVAAMGDTAFFGNDTTLLAVDFSNPASPVKLGEVTVPKLIKDITLSGNYAYLVDHYNGLHVIDISNPDSLFEAGFYSTEGGPNGVAISGDFAYVADVDSGLIVIDVSDPDSLSEVGTLLTDGYATDVAVRGNYAYVADGLDGLRVINISDPDSLYEAGFFDTGSYACGVVVDGNFAYVADFDDGLRVIDISNPDSLDEIGFFDTAGQSWSVAVNGNFAYVADKGAGLRLIDITDPENLREAGYYDTVDEVLDVAFSNDHVFVADGADGIYLFYTYLVAVLVQNYSAILDNNAINIEWRLSEEVRVSKLAVYRREFTGGSFVRILTSKITRSGLSYTFKDTDCKAGKSYSYIVRLESEDGYRILFETQKISIPRMTLTLRQNYPNPFNPATTITYYLPERLKVSLDIYDVSGRLVTRIVNCVQDSGRHELEWTGIDRGGNSVSSGVYFYRLRAGKKVISRKMILIR